MATYDDLTMALVRADKAGDTDSANLIAAAMKKAKNSNVPYRYDEDIPFDAKPASLKEKAIGTLETAASITTGLTTGMLGTIGGTARGATDTISQGKYGTQEGVELFEDMQAQGAEALTYTPKTKKGQEYTNKAFEFLDALGVAAMAPEFHAIGALAKPALSTIKTPKIKIKTPEIATKPKEKIADSTQPANPIIEEGDIKLAQDILGKMKEDKRVIEDAPKAPLVEEIPTPEIKQPTAFKVVAAKAGSTTIQDANGNIIQRVGTRNWRNNNPGNLEYREYAKSFGAIGTDGRFAVFPDYQTGRNAQANLIFNTKKYKDKTLKDAIAIYAPDFENDTNSYFNAVLKKVGTNKKMSEYSPKERQIILDTMERVEGFAIGKEKILKGDINLQSQHANSAKPVEILEETNIKTKQETPQKYSIDDIFKDLEEKDLKAIASLDTQELSPTTKLYREIKEAGVEDPKAYIQLIQERAKKIYGDTIESTDDLLRAKPLEVGKIDTPQNFEQSVGKSYSDMSFKDLSQHPLYENLLKDRESISAQTANRLTDPALSNRGGGQWTDKNGAWEYEVSRPLSAKTIGENYAGDFVLTKSDVAKIRSGKITPKITQKIRDDLGRLDYDPAYRQTIKGKIDFSKDKAVITIFRDADATTIPHELGHYFRRTLDDVEIKEAEQAFGVKDGVWDAAAEERFANGFTKYLSTGDAPTPALKAVFEKFKVWIRKTWEDIFADADKDFKLNDDQKLFFKAILGDKEAAKKLFSKTGDEATKNILNSDEQINFIKKQGYTEKEAKDIIANKDNKFSEERAKLSTIHQLEYFKNAGYRVENIEHMLYMNIINKKTYSLDRDFLNALDKFYPPEKGKLKLSEKYVLFVKNNFSELDGVAYKDILSGKYQKNDTSPNKLFQVQKGKNENITVDDVKETLSQNRGTYTNIAYTRENWDKAFPDGKIQTPIGEIKMGENQFEKLDPYILDPKNPNRTKQDRRGHLSYIEQTLKNPAIALKSKDAIGEKLLYFKEFETPNGLRQYVSVMIYKDEININISNYTMGYKQMLKEIKKGEVVEIYRGKNADEVTTNQTANPDATSSSSVDTTIPKKGGEVNIPKEQWEANLKEWHKDSHPLTKNEDGSPKVFYHGTGVDNIEIFNPSAPKFSTQAEGVYFSTHQSTAKKYGDNVYETYLNIKNPLIIDGQGKYFNDIADDLNYKLKRAEYDGYDGAIIENVRDYPNGDKGRAQDTAVIFSPNQIKSIHNKGTFDESNPNILYQKKIGDINTQINSIDQKIEKLSQSNDDIRYLEKRISELEQLKKPSPAQKRALTNNKTRLEVAESKAGMTKLKEERAKLTGEKLHEDTTKAKGIFAGVKNTLEKIKNSDAYNATISLHRLQNKHKDYLLEKEALQTSLNKERTYLEELHYGLMEFSDDARTSLYRYMTGEDVSLPKELTEFAGAMREEISTLGQKLVDEGILTPETYATWKDTYLHRTYEKHINKSTIKRIYDESITIDKIFERGKKKVFSESELGDIKEYMYAAGYDQMKLDHANTFDDLIAIASEKSIAEGGVELKRLPNGSVKARVDYTKAERIAMGEIEDVALALPETLMKLQTMVAHSKFLRSLPENIIGDTAKYTPVELEAAGYKKLSGIKYGALNGKYVTKDVAKDIDYVHRQFYGDERGILKAYDKTLSLWKKSKTIYMPTAHLNNFVGNFSLQFGAGANPITSIKNVTQGAIAASKITHFKKLKSKNHLSRLTGAEAKEYNKMLKDTNLMLYYDLEAHGLFGRSGINDILMRNYNADAPIDTKGLARGIDQKATKIYGAEDDVHRFALAKHFMKNEGLTIEEAILEVNKNIPDYTASMTTMGDWLRRSGLAPFWSWSYHATPIMLRQIRERPARAGFVLGAISLLYLGNDINPLDERDTPKGFSFRRVPISRNGDKVTTLKIDKLLPQADLFNWLPGTNEKNALIPENVRTLLIGGFPQSLAGWANNESLYFGTPLTWDDGAFGTYQKNIKYPIQNIAPTPGIISNLWNLIESKMFSKEMRRSNETIDPRETYQELLKIMGINTMTYNINKLEKKQRIRNEK